MAEGPASLPELSEDGPPALPRLGEYQPLEKLGEGAMGIVYRARHVEMDRLVALKLLTNERLQDKRAVERFRREMIAVGKLDHPHIVRAYDAREIDGTRLLVMEYLAGLSLDQLAARLGPLPVADACELIRQAADGLQHAHDHGLVHRDIKPSNLMLACYESGPPLLKILDLGLARIQADWASSEVMTAPGFILGTPDYMAPEQIADSHDVDIRADLYSLGCTLFRLLAGRPPFAGAAQRTALDVMAAHSTETPPSIQKLRPEVPVDLAEVISRMMAKTPVERFQAPREVAAALAPFAEGCELSRLLAAAEQRTGCYDCFGTLLTEAAPTPPLPAANEPTSRPPIPPPLQTTNATVATQATQILPRATSQPVGATLASAWIRTGRRGLATAIGGLVILTLLVTGMIAVFFVGHDGAGRELAAEQNQEDRSEPPRRQTIEPANDASDSDPFATPPGSRPRSWILLSWTAERTMKPDLWLFSGDGRIRLPVTHTADEFETQPSFSPDGRQIAFVRSQTPNAETSIWICRTDGSDPRRLVHSVFDNDKLMSPVWASDNQIYFTWARRPGVVARTELWRIGIQDDKPVFVCDFGQTMGLLGAVVTDVSIRDGELLVLGSTAVEPAATDIYLTDLQGRPLHTLWKDTGELHHDSGAIRSRDGRQIVWQHDFQASVVSGSSNYGLATATRNGAGDWSVELAPYPEFSVLPLGWSPDGRDLLCVRVPAGPAVRSHAVFFLANGQLDRPRDLFGLPDWYMPHDLTTGRIADWRTLPDDVRLPRPDQKPISNPSYRATLRP